MAAEDPILLPAPVKDDVIGATGVVVVLVAATEVEAPKVQLFVGDDVVE